MADDEPLDDARAVATAAAAAAARVVETVAREARDQAAQHRAVVERAQDQARAQQALAGLTGTTTDGRPKAGYDSATERVERDQTREAAGVTADARQVRATADLMNGTDPNQAATGQPATTPAAPPKQPVRQISRSR
jgi:hypothetical protein